MLGVIRPLPISTARPVIFGSIRGVTTVGVMLGVLMLGLMLGTRDSMLRLGERMMLCA